MRNLVFIAIFGVLPALNAGDLRHLHLGQRAFYFDLLVIAYGFIPLSKTFLYFFPQDGSHNFGSTEATQEIDDFWSDQWFYGGPIIITTSDNTDIEISQSELVQLQQHSVTLAAAVASAPNQHHIQLPVSSILLSLLKRTKPNDPNGINAIFFEFTPEALLEIKDEADSFKCEYVSTQITYYLQTSPRGRSPRSQGSPDHNKTPELRASSADAVRTVKLRANSLPPLPNLNGEISKKRGQIKQAAYSARETSPNKVINEEGKKQLRRATASLILPRRVPESQTTESSTTATSTTVKKTRSEPLTIEGSSISATLKVKRTSPRSPSPLVRSEPLTTESSTTATSTTVKRPSRRSPPSKLVRSEPLTTEASSTSTTLTVMTPLEEMVEWSLDIEFQPVICYYYPYIATDVDFANFLRNIDLSHEKNLTFALALIKCFAAEGFPHSPNNVLIEVLSSVITQLRDESLQIRFDETVNKTKQELLRKDQFDNAAISPRKNWQDYTDAEIANAWTFCDTLSFRDMPPLIKNDSSEPELKTKLLPMSDTFDKYVNWIVSEMNDVNAKAKNKNKHKELQALLDRFLNIAKLMIRNGNFHSAFTIYCGLLTSGFRSLAGDKNRFLDQVFDPSKNFSMYRQLIKGFRDLNQTYLYIAGFYGKDFENMQATAKNHKVSLGKCPKAHGAFDKDLAVVIGEFFQQMHRDQRAANYETTGPIGLVRFFIDLGKMDQEEI